MPAAYCVLRHIDTEEVTNMKWYATAYGVMGRMHNGEYMFFATDEDYAESYEAEEE